MEMKQSNNLKKRMETNLKPGDVVMIKDAGSYYNYGIGLVLCIHPVTKNAVVEVSGIIYDYHIYSIHPTSLTKIGEL
jgi:hypothetical protein